MSEEEMEWYWEDFDGNKYWESKGITYLVYVEDGYVKLKEVQSLGEKVNG